MPEGWSRPPKWKQAKAISWIQKVELSNYWHSTRITDIPLAWLKSYLTGCTKFVQLKRLGSCSSPVSSGVPQGSFLCPSCSLFTFCPLDTFSGNFITNSNTMLRIPSFISPLYHPQLYPTAYWRLNHGSHSTSSNSEQWQNWGPPRWYQIHPSTSTPSPCPSTRVRAVVSNWSSKGPLWQQVFIPTKQDHTWLYQLTHPSIFFPHFRGGCRMLPLFSP